jgi:hypothetical protein
MQIVIDHEQQSEHIEPTGCGFECLAWTGDGYGYGVGGNDYTGDGAGGGVDVQKYYIYSVISILRIELPV